jgi:hypothetical protein
MRTFSSSVECSCDCKALRVPPPLSGPDELREKGLSYSRQLYLSGSEGILLVVAHAPKGNRFTTPPIAVITEHRPYESRQQTLRFDEGEIAASTDLPAGDYTVVVTANKCEPFRAYVTVSAGNETVVKANLRELESKGPTFQEVLVKNLIQRDPKSLRNLTVEPGKTLVLDPASKELSMDREYVELRTLRDVKQILGCPDKAFPGERPRFGRFSPSGAPADYPASESLNLAQRAALQEFVYGNSKSVATWESSLDKWVRAEEISIGLWALRDIDVGRNSVLQVTSAGLICNTLSVHYTGRVVFKGPGPIKLEMNHYVRYGLLEQVAAAVHP